MARILAVILIAIGATGITAGGQTDGEQQPQQRIAELEERVTALEAIVSGTAHPINLGRTSLARVTASSVNGKRTMDNMYYGIVNAFDGGENWRNGINYTYWFGDYGSSLWADVYFTSPVSLVSIQVEGGPPFAAVLDFSKGGQEQYSRVTDKLVLAAPAHGVTKVRLVFESSPTGRPEVNEILIWGYVPPGVEYTVQQPRIFLAQREATLAANEAFNGWWFRMVERMQHPVAVEEGDRFVFTYQWETVDVLQVIIDKYTGITTTEELAGFSPRSATRQMPAPAPTPF